MAHNTPRVEQGVLTLPDTDAAGVVVGSEEWFAWLTEGQSFAYRDAAGSFTARPERAGARGWYWKAYRTVGGQLRRRYLGRSPDLTLTRLEAVARALHAADGQAGAVAGADRAPSGAGAPAFAPKFQPPRPTAQLIARPRLTQRLAAGLAGRLTVIAAPAGSGKTTLLGQALAQAERGGRTGDAPPALRAAWLTLDADDNGPHSFVANLATALRQIAPSAGARALGLLRQQPPPPAEVVLGELLRELGADGAGVLVLDDYHQIAAPEVHRLVGLLQEQLPPGVGLVIASRSDPPLPLARLRARGALCELRAPDLRFTCDEAAALLCERMGLSLTADEVATLEARTEGWATGLQLAALALQGRDDPGAFVAAFSGSHRYVVDYLLSEVLGRLPGHLHTFVLQTAILDRLCGPLCDALLDLSAGEGLDSDGEAFSQIVLEELERLNLFLVPLDDERRWYRYHQLFAEVVRGRLRAGSAPETIAALHERASAWFERQGEVVEAIRHAMAARAWESLAALLRRHGLLLATRGQARQVHGWLSALPAAVTRACPTLSLYHGLTLLFLNQPAAAAARLDQAEAAIDLRAGGPGLSAEQADAARGHIALARANIVRGRGDLAGALALSAEADGLLAEQYALARAGTLLNRARAHLLTGVADTAAEALAAEAVEAARAVGNQSATVTALINLALLRQAQGRLQAAAATYDELLAAADGPEGLRALVGGPGYAFGRGELLRSQGELAAAAELLEQGVAMLQGGLALDADLIVLGFVALARVRQAQGRPEAARSAIEALRRAAVERQFVPALLERIAAELAALALAQGDLAGAAAWAEGSGLRLEGAPEYPQERLYLTLAQVAIAQGAAGGGRLAATLDLLARMRAAALAGGRGASLIQLDVAAALAHQAQGDGGRAEAALASALSLAAPEGCRQVFHDHQGALDGLIGGLLRGQALPPMARELAAQLARGAEPAHWELPTPPAGVYAPLAEPLTAREREVLQQIAAGATNGEIAERLVIAVGTVKRHINSLFGKLGVSSRGEAIRAARELGLS